MRVTSIDDMPVLNAKRAIKITVTPKDVAGADPKHPDSCAFANACKREMHVKEVRVHLGRVYLRTNDQNWVRYMTPKSLRSEIIAFDRGGKFVSGEFRLSAPEPSKSTGKRQGSNKKRRGTGKKRRVPHVVTDVRTGPA